MHIWRRFIRILHFISLTLLLGGAIVYCAVFLAKVNLQTIEIVKSILSFLSIANIVMIILCAIWGEEW